MTQLPVTLRFLLMVAVMAAVGATPSAASLFGSRDVPVPQWGVDAAKFPTPAYVGDAASVVLYDEILETIDGQGRATERERKVFRILKPQGRDDAYCAVGYSVDEKINSFHEWTLTAGGQVFAAKDTDFVDAGDPEMSVELSAEKVRIVRSPAADVGATVICEWEELMAPYEREKDWNIQRDTPVVFQALEIDLPPERGFAEDWHNQKPIKAAEAAPNHWRWEVKDEPALELRDIPSRPTRMALEGRMSVQWGEAAVDGIGNQWRALGQWYTGLESGRSDPTPEIAAETARLVAGSSDFYGKLAAITWYVQKNVRYFIVERGIGGLQSHPAADIFRNGYGDCKDKSTLLISMLQAAGIQAFYVPVDDRRGVVDPGDPSLVGNHMITAIELPEGLNDARLQAVVKATDGKRYLIFDPTNERTPVGNLPSYEQGSYGLLAAGASSQVIALPVLPPDSNTTTHTGKFSLGEDGSLTGSVDVLRIGPGGADMRMGFKYSDEKERHDALEKTVALDLPGVSLNQLQFTLPEGLDKPAELQYSVTASSYAHSAGNLLLVRTRVVDTDSQEWNDKPRTLPIELEAAGRWRDQFDITLPAGYVVDELPDPVDVDTDFASYHSKTTEVGNALHYEREYVVRKVEIPASEAAAFTKLEGMIGEDEQAAAVLRKR